MALPAYRALFRATRIAFHNDERMLTASRAQIRAAFRANAALAPAGPAIEHAAAVATFLRANVVQGERAAGEADSELYSTWRARW